MKGIFSFFKIIFLVFFLKNFSLLFSTPDLTIAGYVKPEDGLGKIPISIAEALDNQLSVNFIHTRRLPYIGIPDSMIRVLNHPDSTCGKVVLFTDVLAYYDWQPFRLIENKGMIKLAYSMLETTRIPDSWVKILNEAFDAVVVPDESLVSVYELSGVIIPIFVLPIPMMLKPYFEHPIHSESPSTSFTFLDASVNKNPGVLIEAFAKAFGDNPAVRLILRAGVIHGETRNIINRLLAQYGLTNVNIEEGFLPLNHMINRLISCDCYVNLSRGEGFSFLPREALSLGLPVIITDNTALATICNSDCVRVVHSRKRGVPLPVYLNFFREDIGEQFDCDVDDVVEALLDVYNHYEKYIHKARQGRQWVEQYDVANPELQNKYLALVKPGSVVLGNENVIKDDGIVTNSLNLFMKYQDLISMEAP